MALLGESIVLVFVIIQYLLALGIIFFERRNPTSALGWILVLMLLPIIGFFLYLFFGQNWTKRRLFSLKAAEDRSIAEAVVSQEKELKGLEPGTTADPRTEPFIGVARMFLENNRSLLTTENEVTLFTDGTEKFRSLFEDIRSARHHIHLQYYIIRDDPLGKELVQLLTEMARKGVDIRLLYDGLGMKIKKYGRGLASQ